MRESADGSRLAAVGTWASKLMLLSLPTLAVVREHDLETTVIPRSALFFDIASSPALLLGMGDGQLAHWKVCSASVVRRIAHLHLYEVNLRIRCTRGT